MRQVGRLAWCDVVCRRALYMHGMAPLSSCGQAFRQGVIVSACSIQSSCHCPAPETQHRRAYARCLLELTAAASVLLPHTLGCTPRRRIKWLRPNTARWRAVATLLQLASPRVARRCILGTLSSSTGARASQLSEQGVLAALANRLRVSASRELLPPLLARLLPPADKSWAESCSIICHQSRLAGPAGSALQQQEAASAVAGLLSMLQKLLAQLPGLAEASGEPLCSYVVLQAAAEAAALLGHRWGTTVHWAVQVLL